MKTHKEYTLELAGRKMTARFTDLADQANGSVILESSGTVVLATAVMGSDTKNNPGFFNLTVDYLEKFYASGEILGGQYSKREGKPSDEAILSSRVIDRTIRPLFSKHIKNAVQVICTVLAVGESDPGILAVNAASLALATSDIPWGGPVGAVHISKTKNNGGLTVDYYVPNNGKTDADNKYELDMTVCGREGTINMIETMAFELSEFEIGEAFDLAVAAITEIENWQKKIVQDLGKEKLEIPKTIVPQNMVALFETEIAPHLQSAICTTDRMNKTGVKEIEKKWNSLMEAHIPETEKEVRGATVDFLEEKIDELVHNEAIVSNRRVDGRSMDEVRDIFAQAGGVSPILHGSGIFYRGETHVLSVLALGGPKDAQIVEGMEVKGEKRFMHHYNFPPYSAGETGRIGVTNRRELGHGFLAEKALVPVIPDKALFPYTIRVVSESMASNGSTSQASICGASIALMDGGVPIKRPVAGIAMGAILGENGAYKILTDIQGPEDHYGDMDFKVAGTSEGITAIQLDIKVAGMPVNILKEALIGAKKARTHILDVITKEIAEPRKDISPNAPKIVSLQINPEKIGLVIGKGGETIQGIQEETGSIVSIEDDGMVYAMGKNGSAESAIEKIKALTKEWEIGEATTAVITKIMEFGAFAKLPSGHEGLVHISEIAPFRVEKVGDFLAEGQTVPVKIVKKENGKIGLSIKEANKEFVKKPEQIIPPKV